MKVLINYIREPTGHKRINKYSTMKLNENDNSIWEIVEVEDTAEPTKIEFDENNNLITDIEKTRLQKQVEEMAQTMIDKEFEELIKGELNL